MLFPDVEFPTAVTLLPAVLFPIVEFPAAAGAAVAFPAVVALPEVPLEAPVSGVKIHVTLGVGKPPIRHVIVRVSLGWCWLTKSMSVWLIAEVAGAMTTHGRAGWGGGFRLFKNQM